MDKFKVLHENVISDEGVKEKRDVFGAVVLSSCILISMILVVLGVMMFFFV